MLRVTNGTLNLNSLTIADGNAVDADDLPGEGGAILSEGQLLSITNCTFPNNVASSCSGQCDLSLGGAISSNGSMTISNSSFTGNSAQEGGAIDAQGTLTISHSIFLDNSSDVPEDSGNNHGGAINFAGSSMSVSDSSFIGNASSDLEGDGGHGGAIAFLTAGADLSIDNSTFSQNVGALGGAIEYIGGSLTVTNSTFSNNTAPEQGGAIDAAIFGAGATITNTTFFNNTTYNWRRWHL